ncbi:MAG: hypothetical protein K6C13_11910 [Oscillospiraceae bacterium]|nr:hypothetical protein [Oscillospiraceae bacterium]
MGKFKNCRVIRVISGLDREEMSVFLPEDAGIFKTAFIFKAVGVIVVEYQQIGVPVSDLAALAVL